MNSATKSEFQWGRVVFFGRDINEYVAMFNLDLDAMRGLKILDCCAGPAAFAMQAAERGIDVIACDPLYDKDPQELRKCVEEDTRAVEEKQAKTRDLFHAELVPVSERRKAMELFLADFGKPENSERYVSCELPTLPFGDKSFDVVLCSNLLFLYSDAQYGGMITEGSPFDYMFHQRALEEMVRVCRQDARIYPLQGPAADEHGFLRPLMKQLTSQGFTCTLEPVAQRDIIGAEQMLRIIR